jgi:hypothetical protein
MQCVPVEGPAAIDALEHSTTSRFERIGGRDLLEERQQRRRRQQGGLGISAVRVS